MTLTLFFDFFQSDYSITQKNTGSGASVTLDSANTNTSRSTALISIDKKNGRTENVNIGIMNRSDDSSEDNDEIIIREIGIDAVEGVSQKNIPFTFTTNTWTSFNSIHILQKGAKKLLVKYFYGETVIN